MAYAALLSLAQALDQISHLNQYNSSLLKPKTASDLHEHVGILLKFIEDHSQSHNSEMIDRLERRIQDAAYQAQDIIEFHHIFNNPEKNETKEGKGEGTKSKDAMPSSQETISQSTDRDHQEFQKVLEEVDFILEDVNKIRNQKDEKQPIDESVYSTSSTTTTPALGEKNDIIVGFDDDFKAIKHCLYGTSSELRIVPIVGMGGMGKTTLARKVYDEAIRTQYFDRCEWTIVSQEYSIKRILLGILRSLTPQTTDDIHKKSEGDLLQQIHKELFGRRYLIVLDDVWTTKAWDELRRIFPDSGSGSRILLTTRISDVGVYASNSSSPPHEMHFLNEEQSWSLLRQKAFEKDEEPCPPELEDIGKEIAKSCGGLPITIVVVAGLLLENKRQDYWENTSRNISSTEPTILQQCSKVLALSYDRLPPHLKPCFLYMTAFPQEINAKRLAKLWMAEGFLKRSRSKCLEEVGEEYLDDLVRRNLVLISRKRSNGKLKTVSIHDLLRDICTCKAQEEKFLHHFEDENAQTLANNQNNLRRLSVQLRSSNLKCFKDMKHSTTRSLLFFQIPYGDRLLAIAADFRLLWILDALNISCAVFPNAITKLLNLRYLAFAYDYDEARQLPSSISNLQNLETFVIHQMHLFNYYKILSLPPEIWKMPRLRHLILFEGSYLRDPSGSEVVEETQLQTLSKVTDFKFTEEAIKRLANLKKLGLYYSNIGNWERYHLNNLELLQKLEELKIIVSTDYLDEDFPPRWPEPMPLNFNFPISLKKLTLDTCGFPWKAMTRVGSLPNLEVLKLKSHAFTGKEWNPNEGEFLQLKYLEFSGEDLYYWGADSIHFPSLRCLVVQYAGSRLQEIPLGIGDIPTLELIELHYCGQSILDSVKEIQEQQADMGNDPVEVRLFSSPR